MSDFNQRIANLSPQKHAFLELQLLNKKSAAVTEKQTITRKEASDLCPLSFAQQRLWFLDRLQPNSPLYNIPQALRISGPLKIEALQNALDAIVARHESLRTTFTSVDGKPLQVIAQSRAVKLSVIDVSECISTEPETEVQHLLNKETQCPFNLSQDLMLRVTLLRLGEEEHVLLLVAHHIAFDGWSTGLLLRELTTFYTAFTTGNLMSLPPLPIQYADFAYWQREGLQGEVLQSQLDYWKQQLSGNLPVLELPTDRPRSPVQTFQGAQQTLLLPSWLTEALKRLSHQEGVTLFMTLMAAFQTLLHRYSGQEDILVGSPVANRNSVETEGLIGFFVNTLVMRTNLSGDPTFQELLARVREVALGAYAHQDAPFEKLVEELQPERDSSHNPLFQAMFALQNAPMPALEMADLTLAPLDIHNGTSKFDLLLSMNDNEQGLVGVWEYNTDLFDATTITRMAGHFQILLEGIVASPQERVSNLPLLSAREQHQLLVEWNQTQIDYPQDDCIHHLFEAQVERTPDAIAVVYETQQLTYQELNQRANQLAHYLQTLGVGPEVIVGIYIERSVEMVVGLLGILKAGGSYVPLDPAYPQERLAFMLSDAQAIVLLTQHRLLEQLPQHEAHVVCIDTDWETITQQSEKNPNSGVKLENLAYTIYTSGSTGKPKGVQIIHQAVLNFLTSMRAEPGLTQQDVILALTTICFDIAVLELYLPMIVGARIVLVSREVASDAAQLIKTVAKESVTVMQATPATWRMLLGAGWEGNKQLKILCGGEALTRDLANQLLEKVNTVWNMYGPTETTVWSAVYKVKPGNGPIPIGRPIANTQIYLLDHPRRQGDPIKPVPIGVPGEVYIGGVGLARGYLNRPELNDEKFINNPFDESGSRFYRTGDLARYLPDGNIECLGRIDHQVKIRGFRIELGEIEAVLSKHPSVRETVVIAREDVPGDKRLVAYIVSHQNQEPTTSELRSLLKEKLPEYMVPSAFVFLEALPLTPNGKVDRRALPMPEPSRPELGKDFVAPQDTLELQLTRIWEEVLNIQPIGVRDNFFDLGGHSLLAVRLLSQIEKTFGKNLPLPTLFHSPTIEQLANILRSWGCDAPIETLVPLKLGGDKPPLFCIYGILLYHDLARNLDPEQPVYGVYLQDEVDLLQAGKLEEQISALTSVTDLASRYLKEIRTLQPEGPYFLAGSSFGGLVAFEIAQQLHRQGEKVALLALFDTLGPGGKKNLPWHERVFIHLKNFLQEGSTYALKKVKRRISLSNHRLLSVINRIYGNFVIKNESSLPSYLQEVAQRDIRRQVRDRAEGNYVPHPYPGKMILFRAMKRKQVEEFYDIDPQFGWGELAAGGLEIHHVPGDHIGILKEPNVQVLAEKLRDCLDKAQADDRQ